MEWALALVALALLCVAAVSQRLSGTPITPAILFVAFGLLGGPKVLDGIDLSSSSATVRALAETTLALVLFSDASRIDLGALRRTVGVPRPRAASSWLRRRRRSSGRPAQAPSGSRRPTTAAHR
jgi:sodium/hydrogen antiporter